ncbi:hypothetical protein VTJ49DRAFT_7613 [Mycothermus thermophilus]|uniref:Uncharacterized protein n=1 Tax=Humicola insolens TaxID=85995 RepID=A0ABR3VGD4_HUMIN
MTRGEGVMRGILTYLISGNVQRFVWASTKGLRNMPLMVGLTRAASASTTNSNPSLDTRVRYLFSLSSAMVGLRSLTSLTWRMDGDVGDVMTKLKENNNQASLENPADNPSPAASCPDGRDKSGSRWEGIRCRWHLAATRRDRDQKEFKGFAGEMTTPQKARQPLRLGIHQKCTSHPEPRQLKTPQRVCLVPQLFQPGTSVTFCWRRLEDCKQASSC